MNNFSESKVILRYLALLILLFFFVPTFAQEEIYHLNKISTKNNLTSGSYNYFIYKDSYRFVWISSINGLNRYDGKEIKQFTSRSSSSKSIEENNIQGHFFEDKKNNLWFATVGGIYCYEREKEEFQKITIKDEYGREITKGYRLFFLDKENEELWITAENVFAILPIGKSKDIVLLNDEYLNLNSKIVKDSIQGLHFLFRPLHPNLGLEIKCFNESRVVERKKNPLRILSGHKVNSIVPGECGNIWIGTNKGLFLFNFKNGQLDKITLETKSPITHVSDLGKQNLGIVVDEKHLFLFNKQSRKLKRIILTWGDERLIQFTKKIKRVYCDNDQIVWITTYNDGVYFFNLKKKKFSSFLTNFNNTDYNLEVKSIIEGKTNEIWVLTDTGVKILGFVKGITPSFKVVGDLKFDDVIHHLNKDIKNRILVCGNKGLYISSDITQERFRQYSLKLEDSSFNLLFRFSYQLSNGRILFSSNGNGIYELTKKNQVIRLKEMQPFKGEFNRIFEDKKSHVYIYEIDKGIHVLKTNKIDLKYFKFIPFNPDITGVEFNNNLLFLTTNSGLFTLNTKNDSFNLTRDSLFSQSLSGIVKDANNDFWISTQDGLIKYDLRKKQIVNYNIYDGLQGTEFNFGSYLKSSDGSIFFGEKNGGNHFYPKDVKPINTNARPIISKILINDQTPKEKLICSKTGSSSIDNLKKIILKPNQNTISFYFAPLEYSDPSTNLFRYMLKGFDEKFVENRTNNFTRYPNLPHGNYTLLIQTSNSDGIWSKETAKLEVKILPPWHKTTIARVIGVILFLLSVFGLYRFRG